MALRTSLLTQLAQNLRRVGNPARIQQAPGTHVDAEWVKTWVAELLKPAAQACQEQNLTVVHSGIFPADPLVSRQGLFIDGARHARGTFLQLTNRRPAAAFLYLDHDRMTPANQALARERYRVMEPNGIMGRSVLLRQPLHRMASMQKTQQSLEAQVRAFAVQPETLRLPPLTFLDDVQF